MVRDFFAGLPAKQAESARGFSSVAALPRPANSPGMPDNLVHVATAHLAEVVF